MWTGLRSRIICRALFRHALPVRPSAKFVLCWLAIATVAGSMLLAAACGGDKEGVAFTPAPIGPGKLAYVQDGDIWLKLLPDGQPRRITTSAQAGYPRWSPSGQWLTFSDSQAAWVVREDGTGLRKIEGFGRWSPVDDRYVGIDSGGTITIFTENADGSDRRVVAKYFPSNGHLANQIRGPLWSPDGRWIAYTMLQQGIPEMPPYRAASMWIVSAAGGTPAKVYDAGSPSVDDVGLVGWSPDGHALFFTLDPFFSASAPADGLALQAIVVLPDIAAKSRDFAPAPARMLLKNEFWSARPDGATIAITDGSGRETWMNKRIAIVSWGAGTVTGVTPEDVAAIEPAWSPDGKRIAYVAAPDAGTSVSGGDAAKAAMAKRKIWVMDADGSDQRQLTSDPAYRDERPQWTADGSHILFVRLDANDKASLWLISADDGAPERVVNDLPVIAFDGSPAWWGYYGYIGWDSQFAWWSPPGTPPEAAATNALPLPSPGP